MTDAPRPAGPERVNYLKVLGFGRFTDEGLRMIADGSLDPHNMGRWYSDNVPVTGPNIEEANEFLKRLATEALSLREELAALRARAPADEAARKVAEAADADDYCRLVDAVRTLLRTMDSLGRAATRRDAAEVDRWNRASDAAFISLRALVQNQPKHGARHDEDSRARLARHIVGTVRWSMTHGEADALAEQRIDSMLRAWCTGEVLDECDRCGADRADCEDIGGHLICAECRAEEMEKAP